MHMAAVECGSLCCQRDSFARSLSTKVLSCTPSSPEERQHGAYAVQLENTVLFPEGGGQVRPATYSMNINTISLPGLIW